MSRAALVLLLVAASIVACAKSPDAGKPKVAFLLSTLQEERYQIGRAHV